eukprot:4200618-Prymnesium_polylepis.1
MARTQSGEVISAVISPGKVPHSFVCQTFRHPWVGGFPGEVWTPLLPTPYSPPQHRVHRDAASSSSLRHPPRRPRAPTAAQSLARLA